MLPSSSFARRWDIFCTVVDNFGDIGICWRLARQLVAEHGQQVCLWVDDLHSFRRICPAIDPARSRQSCRGVDIRQWSKPLPALALQDVPDIVVEAFACCIPDNYIALMAQRSNAPLWINMEYLSAEDWILGCHGLHSPHPRYRLQKTFFFPGFVVGSGGLLREKQLLEQRDAFRDSSAAQAAFWHSLDMRPPLADELRISMFAYDQPQAELAALVCLWSESPTPITLCAAEGRLAQQLLVAMHGQTRLGQLQLQVLPFLEQDRFDRLLWACDLNFVRGEDSFVRAQWAGQPLVWQIYRQQEQAHMVKLEAFLALYQQGLPAGVAQAQQGFWQAWNSGANLAASWPAFQAVQQSLREYNKAWLKNILNNGDFTTNLMIYCQKYL